jgi:hypothetical protein
MEIKSTLRRSRKDACLCSRLVKQTNLSTLRLRSIVVVNRIHEKESLDPGSAISNPVIQRQSSFCMETPPHRQHSTAGVRCSYETKQDRSVVNQYSPIGLWYVPVRAQISYLSLSIQTGRHPTLSFARSCVMAAKLWSCDGLDTSVGAQLSSTFSLHHLGYILALSVLRGACRVWREQARMELTLPG